MISPSLVLSVIVGLFNASAYVFIRGRAGARLPFLLAAAILGAWAGDALGARLGTDLAQIGDFHLIAATVLAWVGMGLVALISVAVPGRGDAVTVGSGRAGRIADRPAATPPPNAAASNAGEVSS